MTRHKMHRNNEPRKAGLVFFLCIPHATASTRQTSPPLARRPGHPELDAVANSGTTVLAESRLARSSFVRNHAQQRWDPTMRQPSDLISGPYLAAGLRETHRPPEPVRDGTDDDSQPMLGLC